MKPSYDAGGGGGRGWGLGGDVSEEGSRETSQFPPFLEPDSPHPSMLPSLPFPPFFLPELPRKISSVPWDDFL